MIFVMAKKVIRLTESELKQVLEESIKRIINEVDMDIATIPDVTSRTTSDSIVSGKCHTTLNNKQVDPFNHNKKARVLRNKILTKYILDEIGNIHFRFMKYDDSVGYPVACDFDMTEIKDCNKDHISLQGVMEIPTNKGIINRGCVITYKFSTDKFYHSTYVNRNKKDVELVLPTDGEVGMPNSAMKNRLVFLVEDYLKRCDKNYNTILSCKTFKDLPDLLTKLKRFKS